jgi:nitric-oxide synthase
VKESPGSAEAIAFLRLCAEELSWEGAKLQERIAAVESGPWQPEQEELEHGARVAWRNNARCIGRLFWPSLKVRDLRHVSAPEEIHAALLSHAEAATNGGKIQPMLTVFAPADRDGAVVRIWNHQLFGYAGYRQPDGTVVGDPKNEAFTHVVQRLGWEGSGGPFDLLPLVIQRRGEAPQLFPPPVRQCLEVPLQHPEFPWFAELGLRWYAVPLLSDMRLRLGGIDFPAAPFNGWYMGTEIGRDLGDEARYHLLPKLADAMGLSRRDPMWKDRTLLELHAAVLHSYAVAGVRIVDHHRASSDFMEFTAREQKAGRAVSADWSWIVPPMSASATPVFHRLWQDRGLLPEYQLQPSCWEG